MPSEPAAAAAADARPRRLHRLTLVFGSLKIARAMVFPALAATLGTARDDAGHAIAIGLGMLAIPALVVAIAHYVAFRFALAGGELVLDSGVLRRQRRVIPLARVQNIDVRQSGLERLFGVAELRVETAGGVRSEAVLSVLGRAEAEALRDELLRRRGEAEKSEKAGGGGEGGALVVARLSPLDLAVAGATANEAGLVAAALAGALQLLDDLPLELPEPVVNPLALVADLPAAALALAVAGLLLLFVLLGWILSVAGAVVGYHGFTLERVGPELRKRYGLLGRREASVPLRRVQALRIEESLLRRPFGLAALKVETAGAAPGQRQRGGAEAFLPLARRDEMPRLVAAACAGLDYPALRLLPVHPRARRRIWLRLALPIALGSATAAALVDPGGLALLLLLLPAWLLAGRQFRHRGYARVPGYIVTRAGFFNRITWVVPEDKVQTLHLEETPFQRRHGLATLIVDTAGGRGEARIVDLGREEAAALLDDLARRPARVRARPPR